MIRSRRLIAADGVWATAGFLSCASLTAISGRSRSSMRAETGATRQLRAIAWENLSGWLVAHNARRHIRRGFGIFRDNPQVTATDLLRYDACVEMTPGLDMDVNAGIGRQVLGGGTHAIHTHVGSYGGLGNLMSELHRDFVPRQGLTVDYDRPFMAIHLNDPLLTREVHRRTELCVPVMPLPLAIGEDLGVARPRRSAAALRRLGPGSAHVARQRPGQRPALGKQSVAPAALHVARAWPGRRQPSDP